MFNLGDTVLMKKPHACGVNDWEVIRLGADIKIKCMGCGHLVMMPRPEFTKKMKKVLVPATDQEAKRSEHYVSADRIKRPNQI